MTEFLPLLIVVTAALGCIAIGLAVFVIGNITHRT
jgi:hypothetical protein